MGLGNGTSLLQIERVHEVSRPVVAHVHVRDPDQHERRVVAGRRLHVRDGDARFEVGERELDFALDEGPRRARVRCHQIPAESATERRTHDALAGAGIQNDPDRLRHPVGPRRVRDPSVRHQRNRESPALPEKRQRAHTCVTSASKSRLAVGEGAPDAAGVVLPAALTSKSMFARAMGEYLLFRFPVASAPKLASSLALRSVVLMDASSASRSVVASNSSSALMPAATCRSGGMQNLSASIHHSWKRNMMIGRKSSNTNIATIVMSGIGKKQISGIAEAPLSVAFPEESTENMSEPGGFAKPTPSAGFAWAASSLRSGSCTVTG